MECKFKEGDAIKCIVNKFDYVDKGEIVTIEHISEHCVQFHGVHGAIYTIIEVNKCFELVESGKDNKWHPHHDLIIKWLSDPDMVVDVFNISIRDWHKVDEPNWSVTSKYRVYHKDTAPEQRELEDIEYQIAKLQAKANELKARMENS